MATYDRNSGSRRTARGNGHDHTPPDPDERLGDLLRRFAQDAGALIRHEIALAKLELRDNIKDYARNASKVAIAAGIGVMGVFALLACAIMGLGELLDNDWLAALLVGALLLIAAAVMARSALAHMRRDSVAPVETVATLKEDKRWMQHEARDMKRRLKA